MKSSIAVLVSLLTAPLMAADVPVSVGDTSLLIPEPVGYVRVMPDTAYDRLQESAVVQQNLRLVSFVPEEFLPAIKRGQVPPIERTLSVQTAKATINRTITTSDFKELKKTVSGQNARMMEAVEKQAPNEMKAINDRLKGQFGAKINLSFNGMVPLGAPDETERSLAFSMFVKYSVTAAAGGPTNFTGIVTAMFLHLRSKLIFLYVNGGEDDLEWTRTTARNWAAAIIAANPPDAETLARENQPSGGFDWKRVALFGLIGAAVGGIIELIRRFSKRNSS